MNNVTKTVIVESVIDLTEAEKKVIEKYIQNRVSEIQYNIKYSKNSKLLGGIRIAGPDWVSDGSLAVQLKDLTDSLK